MPVLRILLLPVAWLYEGITRLRNWLYDKGYKKSTSFPLPVISVGNLTVGGTGKTPHVEYLVRLLKDQRQLVTLSRGYGRQTKGFLIADEQANAATIGDEPMQFYQKFGHQIKVAVGEKRVPAIEQILRLYPKTEIILLDDAFQHRAVRPCFSILLSDYHRPFYTDFVLPAGRLRESRKGAGRADAVIFSKCPQNLSAAGLFISPVYIMGSPSPIILPPYPDPMFYWYPDWQTLHRWRNMYVPGTACFTIWILMIIIHIPGRIY
jgi:tetraacyldisaccharide 4'-kinase